jgi:hypothetical protein
MPPIETVPTEGESLMAFRIAWVPAVPITDLVFVLL